MSRGPPTVNDVSVRRENGAMAYIEGRVVHDADAHIMEWPTWLADYADPQWRDRIGPR